MAKLPTAANASLAELCSERPQSTRMASASMVPLFTARAVSPSHVPVALPRTSISLRGIWPRTSGRLPLCPVASRASGTWTSNDVKKYHRPMSVKPLAYRPCGDGYAGLFSTSAIRRLKIENETKEQASRNNTEVRSTLLIDGLLQVSSVKSISSQHSQHPCSFLLIQVKVFFNLFQAVLCGICPPL